MDELVKIGNHEISIKSYMGQRVVTFKDIDMVHERPEGTARKRFHDNKARFIKGEDYFKVKCSEVRPFFGQTPPNGFNPDAEITLFTESGYLMLVKSFTDDLAWEVQRKLVDQYFKAKQIVNEELSPQMQLLMQMVNTMAQKELEDKERDRRIEEAKDVAQKAVETAERMRDEFISPFENWREDINKKVRKISRESGISYQNLFSDMYTELEHAARCDLAARQRNKQERMRKAGCTKTDVQKETTKIAVVEEDPKLRQIFEDIVRKYSMKYIA